MYCLLMDLFWMIENDVGADCGRRRFLCWRAQVGQIQKVDLLAASLDATIEDLGFRKLFVEYLDARE